MLFKEKYTKLIEKTKRKAMVSKKQKGKYKNLHSIKMTISLDKLKKMGKDFIKKKNATPPFKLPRMKIDKEKFKSTNTLIWLGHSTILGNIDGVSFIVDPMLTNRASPLKCVGPKRFDGTISPFEQLPDIDVILITHNHYDHLDKKSILHLKDKVKSIYTPLDNKKILTKWGVAEYMVKEFDWFEDINFNNVQFSFCPTQHFSSRGLTDRDKCLWGSWAIMGSKKVYVSGDSGYNEHFKLIGDKYGEFDLACIECGAYNENWSEVHMLPEQSVQASVDIKAKLMLPMHWAGFDLSTHPWDEPITRAIKKAKELKVKTTTPMIGQVLDLGNPIVNVKWWEKSFCK